MLAGWLRLRYFRLPIRAIKVQFEEWAKIVANFGPSCVIEP